MFDALPDLLLRSRHARTLALLVDALLLALLLWLSVRLIWMLLAGPGDPIGALPAGTTRAASAQDAPLASWHLFGNALPVNDGRSVAAPSTGLRLSL